MISFYNTLTRKTEKFHSINKNEARIYSCGPTVYDYAHIGNFRSYIFTDILIRLLRYKGYKTIQIMNITDVDDKTINGANKLNIPLKKYTEKYENAFFEDIETLRIVKADKYPRATEHITEMIDLIKLIDKKNISYELDGSIYFSIKKFSEYGKLSGVDLNSIMDGARVDQDEYQKEDVKDFVLWKKAKANEPFWETEYGKGRPGWHIECSSMSMKYLGETFDIHTGGVDLVFPHHENEIAQSTAATGKPFVNYWLHCEHLIVEGEKMSKSKGNFFTLRDLLKKGYSPTAIRYLLISTHYRKQLNFTKESLSAAAAAVQRINDCYDKINNYKCNNSDSAHDYIDIRLAEFENELSNDLGISPALAAFFEFIKKVNIRMGKKIIGKSEKNKIISAFNKFNSITDILVETRDISKEIDDMIRQREEARKNKDFGKADEIRNKLTELGIILEDTPDGTRWKKGTAW